MKPFDQDYEINEAFNNLANLHRDPEAKINTQIKIEKKIGSANYFTVIKHVVKFSVFTLTLVACLWFFQPALEQLWQQMYGDRSNLVPNDNELTELELTEQEITDVEVSIKKELQVINVFNDTYGQFSKCGTFKLPSNTLSSEQGDGDELILFMPEEKHVDLISPHQTKTKYIKACEK